MRSVADAARPRRRGAARPPRGGGSDASCCFRACSLATPAERRRRCSTCRPAPGSSASWSRCRRRSTRSVVLVPRTTADLPEDGLEPAREQLERAGRIDETLIGGRRQRRAPRVPDVVGAAQLEQRSARSTPLSAATARRTDLGWRASWSWRPRVLRPGCSTTRVQPEHVEPAIGTRWSRRPDGAHRRRALAAALAQPPRLRPRPSLPPGASASRARVSRSPVLRELCEAYAQELGRPAGRTTSTARTSAGGWPTGSSTTTRCARSTRAR